jgi:serine O-acetyltransferase
MAYAEGEFDQALDRIVMQATQYDLSNLHFNPQVSSSAFRIAVGQLLQSFPHIRDRYYVPPDSISGLGSHGDIYANLLLRFGAALNSAGHRKEAEIIWAFNKTLHGLDFYAYGEVPEVLQLSHPLGTVIGRASLGTALAVYQGVTIGASRKLENNEYPWFEGRAVLYANSTVLGRCRIGDGAVFGANSLIVDCDVPNNSLVVGQYPAHRFLPGTDKILDSHFRF